MYFEELAKLFKNLENNTEKNVKARLISNFIKNIPKDSLSETFLLLQSRVYYPWEDFKLGVGDKLLIRALSLASGIDKDVIENMYIKSGDIGITAEKVISEKKQKFMITKKLTVKDIYETLRKVGKLEGEGSIDKKVRYITNLFASSSPLEARYIARLILEDLKIGVGEGIIVQGISEYFNVPLEKIEKAYAILNDFGELVRLLLEKGRDYINEISPVVGKPMKVMLAHKVENVLEAFEVVGRPAEIEYKYDGFRVQIHKYKDGKIELWTRRLENVTKQFPDVIEYVKECLPTDKDFIAEGEIVGYKDGKYLPFQRISQRIKRKYDIEKMMKEIPVEVRLFDIIYFDGKSLLDSPFKSRKELLLSILNEKEGKIKFAESIITDSNEEAQKFFEEAIKKGLEGVMFKNLNAPYFPGRRVGYMVKLKPTKETLDVVIVAGEYGEGRRGGYISSFYVAVRDEETGRLLRIGQVSSGLKEKKESPDDVTLEEINNLLKDLIIKEENGVVYFEPKIVIEVLYDNIEKSPRYESGYALRFPRIIRLRPDKSVDDIDTLERIRRLYEEQG